MYIPMLSVVMLVMLVRVSRSVPRSFIAEKTATASLVESVWQVRERRRERKSSFKSTEAVYRCVLPELEISFVQ